MSQLFLSMSGIGQSDSLIKMKCSEFGQTPYRLEEEKAIEHALRKHTPLPAVSFRVGNGGGGCGGDRASHFAYIKRWQLVELANNTFGFNGWSHAVSSLSTDHCECVQGCRYIVLVSAVVKVQLRDGTCHEDLGFGQCEEEGWSSKALALEKASKDAVTDGLKRALRLFGSLMGNCLSDKEYVTFLMSLSEGSSKAVLCQSPNH